MVVLHIKKTDIDQFLYETTCCESNDTVIRDLVWIWNTRIRLQALADAVESLAMYGQNKHPEKCGIDEVLEESGEFIEKGEFYTPDPLGNRTGNGPGPKYKETMDRVAADAKHVLKATLVLQKVPMTKELLTEKLDNLRGAVTMAYPMGLVDHEITKGLLNDDEYANMMAGSSAGQEILDPATAQLWWAGKEFFRDQCMAERVGKNEKTKIVVRLQKQGGGAPQREPAVSEDERKAMMAHYFKKQEEMKKMAEADDDDYLNSTWANPAALKNNLRGTSDIRPF